MSIYKNNKSKEKEHHMSKDGKKTLCGNTITSDGYTKTDYTSLTDVSNDGKNICHKNGCKNA